MYIKTSVILIQATVLEENIKHVQVRWGSATLKQLHTLLYLDIDKPLIVLG
jgi:hypothetical protein